MDAEFLEDARRFHQWVADEIKSGRSASTLYQQLSCLETDVALLRAFNVSHWFLSKQSTVDAARRCERCADRRVEVCVRGYLLHIRIATEGFANKRTRGEYTFYSDILKGDLEELLAAPKDDIRREAEIYLRQALAVAYFFTEDYEKASHQISKSKYLAESIGGLYYLGRINTLFIAINYELGRIPDALTLALNEEKSEHSSSESVFFHEINSAAFQFILGQNERPMELLNQMLMKYSYATKWTVPEIEALMARYEALTGKGVLDKPPHPTDEFSEQTKASIAIASVMTPIIKALGLKRETSKLKNRSAFLEKAASTWSDSQFVSLNRERFLRQWTKAYAYLKQGAYVKAWATVQFTSLEVYDWLDLRVLYAGLKLELAMCLWLDESEIIEAEESLRSVFKRAAQLPHASDEGLAERLMHWFPLASAYGALMPNPIHHLQPALAAVLNIGSKNSVHNIDLSPSITAEFILKALDYDLRPGEFQQFDTPANRKIRDSLLTTYGKVPYYLPYVSTISLVLGLKEAGYHKRAKSVAREYGVVPQKMQGSYKMHPILEELGVATQALLDDEITLEMFRDIIRMSTLENSPAI